MIVPHVVAQHAEEAADLWSLRQGFLKRPEITLRDLARLDERIEAHVDGLRIAGEPARGICEELLSGESGGQVFARFLWAFSTTDSAHIERVILISEGSAESAKGLASALSWLRFPDAEPYARPLLSAASPVLKRAGIATYAAHRRPPGPALRHSISSDDLELRTCALRAVGELGSVEELPATLAHLTEEDPSCRFWAAWSASLLTWHRPALDILQAAVEAGAPMAETALEVLLRQMDPHAARRWVDGLFAAGQQIRSAILALGILGDPAGVPQLIEFMDSKLFARLSGAAFRMITGQDLKRQYLNQLPPEKTSPEAPDTPDEDIAEDPDADLPWPDIQKVKARWSEVSREFVSGHRYLLGTPVSAGSLQHVLITGRRRERVGALSELAVRQPGQPLFNMAAPAFRQQQMLGIKK